MSGRDPATVETAVEELRATGLDVVGAPFDVADHEAARAAVLALGGLDVLVNNVGHRDRRGVDQLEPADMARLLDVHVVAAYALCRTIATGMVEHGTQGRIVNVSSVSGQLGRSGDVPYAAAKAGLDGLTRALAADLGPHGITVNSVAPETFATETNDALAADPEWTSWLRSHTEPGVHGSERLGRGEHGHPEEIQDDQHRAAGRVSAASNRLGPYQVSSLPLTSRDGAPKNCGPSSAVNSYGSSGSTARSCGGSWSGSNRG